MTVEIQVYAALQALVSSNVFPDFAPEGTSPPYVTYQAVGGTPMNFLSGENPGKSSTRMQVSVWAATRLEASALGQQVEDALRAATQLQPEVLTGRIATYDETTKYRGTMQDFNLTC